MAVGCCLTLVFSAPALAAVEVELLFQSDVDGLGQQLRYPGTAAQLTGAIVTLAPGATTGWHTHEIPVAGYVLEGELVVQYHSGETRKFVAGEGVIEVLDAPHQGYNAGEVPLKLVVFYAGGAGIELSAPAAAP